MPQEVSRSDRLTLWASSKVPQRLQDEPERFLLCLAWLVIGIDSTFFGANNSGLRDATHFVRVEVGVLFLCGGISTLIGLIKWQTWLERLGQGFITLGCIVVIYGSVVYEGSGGVALVILYVLVAVTYLLRLLGVTARRLRAEQELRRE